MKNHGSDHVAARSRLTVPILLITAAAVVAASCSSKRVHEEPVLGSALEIRDERFRVVGILDEAPAWFPGLVERGRRGENHVWVPVEALRAAVLPPRLPDPLARLEENLGEPLAIIMDGNGRWATQRGRPRLFGHHAGARRVRQIVEACPDLGVEYLTIFAFSTENWKRTQVEVAGLMSLFRRYITKEARALLKEGVRVRFIGARDRLDDSLKVLMTELETLTEGNSRVNLTIAINYGGRDEVARATKRLAHEVAAGRLDPETVDVETLPRFLDTCVLPDPDLVIRTSGEARISNFLLWQSAYAEYEFIDTLWPDFTADEFARLCRAYGARDRRYGGVRA